MTFKHHTQSLKRAGRSFGELEAAVLRDLTSGMLSGKFSRGVDTAWLLHNRAVIGKLLLGANKMLATISKQKLEDKRIKAA